MNESRKFIVERRTSENERPAGWMVRQENGHMFPWEVVTLVADHNWDGEVFVGGLVCRAGDFDDGRARFVCERDQAA